VTDARPGGAPTIVVVNGPIASGKSSISRLVAASAAADGATTALVDLDLLHDMLVNAPHEREWELARRATGAVTAALVAGGVDVVVVDAELMTQADRDDCVGRLDDPDDVRFVTLTVSYPEALRRARADEGRGVSRDPAFLEPYYTGVLPELRAVPETDLVVDTERVGLDEAAATVLAFIDRGTARA
jgi:chloramphenicol 3-O-phosphotransferase